MLRPQHDSGLAPIRVLCYHGIVESRKDACLERNFHLRSEFERHLDVLRHFTVLRATDLADPAVWHERGAPGVVVTFDDGHASKVLVQELLAARRLPWTLFVPTGAIGAEGSIWTAELALLLLHGESPAVELLGARWSMGGSEERQEAYRCIRTAMKQLPADERRQSFLELRQQFPPGEIQRLLSLFPSLRMLTWDQVRAMQDEGVEVGSHGVDHELHHQRQPEDIRRDELFQSRDTLRSRLGSECVSFAFPNGDVNPESPREVREAGYQVAFTTREAPVMPDTDVFLLPRFTPSGEATALGRLLSST